MSEKELERLMMIALSDYEIARKNSYNDIMLYNTGKIIAYNQISSLMKFKLRADYSKDLGEYKIIHT